MATLSRGQTFGATETITNTKLHALVDSATLSSITNADIDAGAAITDSKLGDITTGNKVSGKALFNLASTPSGAGLLPGINVNGLSLASIPVSGINYSALGVSLVSIPASGIAAVNAINLQNLSSIPVSQQVPYNLLVSSLASGAYPRYNGATNFVGAALSTDLTKQTQVSFTTASPTADVPITAGKRYVIFIRLTAVSADTALYLRFNSDSTGDDYQWTLGVIQSSATPSETLTGDDADTEIEMGTIDTTGTRYWYYLTFDNTYNNGCFISGTGGGLNSGGLWETRRLTGFYSGGQPTSFELVASTGTLTGVIDYYELS